MAGISTTGRPDVRNYTLVKGRAMFSFLSPVTGLPGAWREVGNSCETTFSATTSTEKHYQCLQKIRTADLEYITELDGTLSIRFDEWMYENLAAFLVGQARTRTTIAAGAAAVNATGFVYTDDQFSGPGATFGDQRVGGRWYELGVSQAGTSIAGYHPLLNHSRRLYQVTAGNISITPVGGGTYTGVPVGTPPGALEFEVDEDHGMFFVAPGSQLETELNAASTGAASVQSASINIGAFPAQQQDEVAALTGDQVALAVKIVGINGANAAVDELFEVIFFQVIFRPNGDLPMFSETELSRFTLEGTLQQNVRADPAGNGFFTIRKIT